MGFFDDSFLGFDFNMDGKVDMMDDVLFMSMMEESNKANDEKGFDPGNSEVKVTNFRYPEELRKGDCQP